ncbi:MAG: hypothetical protein P4M01_13330 [Acidobacteriota bacterium]|nr:hypothetical protein [Acidobacteriota bacterium]
MRNFQKLVAVIALSGLCFAAPSDSGVKKKAKPAKTEVSADQIKDLRQAIEQQQAATAQLQEQLKQTQQELQQTRQDLSAAQAAANAANAKASAIDSTNVQVQKVQADLSDVKGDLAKNDATTAKVAKSVADLEHPNSIAFKGVRITPGGFFDLTGYYRERANNSGPATSFNAIPLENALSGSTSFGNLSEFAMSARASQLKLRLDGDAGKLKLTGYVEGDFYGVGSANPNQTTAWPFRVRQAWGRVKTTDGWSITGGQMWNLVTMNRKAADADAPWVPNTLDTNYVVGWDWGREAEIRVAKSFDKKFTVAFSAIDPSLIQNGLTYIGASQNGIAGILTTGSGNLGSSFATTCADVSTASTTAACSYTSTFSTNVAPDIAVKLAYDDPKLGHYEVKAVQRFFRDRYGVTKHYTDGTGFGAGAIIPVVPKKVDVIFQGLFGKGISRYQDSGQADVVVRANTYSYLASALTYTSGGTTTTVLPAGTIYATSTFAGAPSPVGTLQDVKGASAILGAETHPTPRFELDVYAGTEYYFRSLYYNRALGAPVATSATTYTQTVGAWQKLGYGIGGSNKAIIDGTLAAWYDVYKGAAGILRYGGQYEYVNRQLWQMSGVKQPKGIDNDVYLGMRYIFP